MALCTIVAHNIAQNRPDNFPSYPPDNNRRSDDVYLREGGYFCTMYLTAKFHHPTFNRSTVIVQTNKLTNKQTLLKTSTMALLRYSGG